MNYIVYLDGQQIPISNAAELVDGSEWVDDSPNATQTAINSIEVETPDALNIINLWIAQNGIYQGIPCQIIDRVTGESIFDGIANLLDAKNQFNPYRNHRKIIINEFSQVLEKNMASFNLRTLFPKTTYIHDGVEISEEEYNSLLSQGALNLNKSEPSQFSFTFNELDEVFYVINRIPNYEQSALIAVSIYVITVQAVDLYKKVADSASPFTAFQIVTTAIYLAGLLVSLINLLKSLVDTLIQKQKKYCCVNVKTTFEKAFAFLGYGFESSILNGEYAKATYIEATNESGVARGQTNNNPLPNSTLIDFMQRYASLWNAKFKINETSKIIQFERVDFFKENPINYEIPILQNNNRQTIYNETTNAAQLAQSFSLSFAKDGLEANTHTPDAPKDIRVTYTFNGTSPQNNVFTENKEIELPFTHALRKEKDTTLDKLLNGLYDIIQFILGAGSLQDIGIRTGAMLLNLDAIPIAKTFILENRKISPESAMLFSPLYLYENYHKVSSILENQYINVNVESPFEIIPKEFFRQLKDWNVCKLQGFDNDVVVTKIDRNVENGTQTIEYKRREDYINPSEITETITLID